jgi:hypothetical protein
MTESLAARELEDVFEEHHEGDQADVPLTSNGTSSQSNAPRRNR